MPSLRRRASVTDPDPVEIPTKKSENGADALTLAEQAEAEAAEADAVAAAARARAKAIRLRQEAEAAEAEAAETAPAERAGADTEKPENDIDESEQATEEASVIPGRSVDTGPSVLKVVLSVIAILVAVLGTAALLTFSGIMHSGHKTVVDDQKLNAEYAAAGRQSVVTLMSLDFNNAEEDVKRIIDNSTGQFKKEFEDQAADFIKVAQDSKVITDVTVNTAAVESMDQDKAVVLVSATSRVTNSAGAKQEPRAWRLSVNLERDGGQIKMAKVEFVP